MAHKKKYIFGLREKAELHCTNAVVMLDMEFFPSARLSYIFQYWFHVVTSHACFCPFNNLICMKICLARTNTIIYAAMLCFFSLSLLSYLYITIPLHYQEVWCFFVDFVNSG